MIDTVTLRELRKQNEMTQKELADLIGVSTVSLNRYEKGLRKPKLDKLKKISEVFGVSIKIISGVDFEENTEKEILVLKTEYDRLKEIERKYNEIKALVND